MGRYEELFDGCAAAQRIAFIPFLTLGDPSPEASATLLDGLVAGGADALELGIPFSDPTADGPTIQKANVRAMDAGVTPAVCWEILGAFRARHPDVPVGLLVYANLVFHRGVDRFYAGARDAGVDSVLVADVPVREVGPFAASAEKHGIQPVLIAPPNADDTKLRAVAEQSRGYTYVVTRSGVTGAQDQFELSNEALVRRLIELGAAPPVLGFGISQPEHVAAAKAIGAAGAISGSAVVRRVEERLDDIPAAAAAIREFTASMVAAT